MKPNTCYCDAYKFPHRDNDKLCLELTKEKRSLPIETRTKYAVAMDEYGLKEKDFL